MLAVELPVCYWLLVSENTVTPPKSRRKRKREPWRMWQDCRTAQAGEVIPMSTSHRNKGLEVWSLRRGSAVNTGLSKPGGRTNSDSYSMLARYPIYLADCARCIALKMLTCSLSAATGKPPTALGANSQRLWQRSLGVAGASCRDCPRHRQPPCLLMSAINNMYR